MFNPSHSTEAFQSFLQQTASKPEKVNMADIVREELEEVRKAKRQGFS